MGGSSASPEKALRAELDRVGISHRKAGAADYVALAIHGTEVTLMAPLRQPRRSWRGGAEEALRRLRSLEDDAGVDTFWAAFG